jgi:hypothetical protein
VWSCAAGEILDAPGPDDGGATVDGTAPEGSTDAPQGSDGGSEAAPPPGEASDDAAAPDDATTSEDAPANDASREPDGSDGGEDGGHDASAHDARADGPEDSGSDAEHDAAADAGPEKDAGTDATVPTDAGGPDTGIDTGEPDTGVDAGEPDTGTDAGVADTGTDAQGESDAEVDAGCSPAAIVINEVQTAGSGGAEDEWVELFNPSSCPIDISGWILKHESINGTTADTVWTASSGVSLGAQGYGVVAGTAYTGAATPIGSFNTGVLAADGGGLGLYDTSATLIDSVGYGSGATNEYVQNQPATAPPSAESAARTPNGVNTHDNAADFSIATTPTPGAMN